MKILLVDDELTILAALSHFLSNKDTTVITANCMAEAQKALTQEYLI